jgi:MATE family multidrug resistance protein
MFVNVFFNYILIYGKFGCPALGIRGAAYGTIIGSLSGLLILLSSYLRKSNRLTYQIEKSWLFDKNVLRTLLRFGYPAGLEMFLNILAFNIMVMIFYSCGAATATAATIVFNWDMVSFIPLIGVEIGVTSLVGRYMGAGKPEIAERSVSSGIKMGVVYSAVIFILFAGFPEMLVNLFKPAQTTEVFNQAFPVAVFMVRWACIYVLIEAMIISFTGALRGAGDSFWAMALSVSLHWTLVPVLYLLLKVFGLSAKVGWITLIGTFFIFSFFIYLRYKSGKWKEIKMVHSENEALGLVHDDFHEPVDL